MPTQVETPPGARLTRALSLLTIVLMLGAIAYAVWIVLENWSAIGV